MFIVSEFRLGFPGFLIFHENEIIFTYKQGSDGWELNVERGLECTELSGSKAVSAVWLHSTGVN